MSHFSQHGTSTIEAIELPINGFIRLTNQCRCLRNVVYKIAQPTEPSDIRDCISKQLEQSLTKSLHRNLKEDTNLPNKKYVDGRHCQEHFHFHYRIPITLL